MNSDLRFLCLLADSLLAGSWVAEELLRRADWPERASFPVPRELVAILLSVYPEVNSRPSQSQLLALLCEVHRDWDVHGPFAIPRSRLSFTYWQTPCPDATRWQLPLLPNSVALADFLGLYPDELTWLADVHGREDRVPSGPLRHYVYRWIPKAAGRWRLIEMPKSRLKATQQRLLRHLLDRIPPHDAAHAYRKGRSVVTFARPHCDRDVVLRFDLKDFFPSVPASRVHALFAALGYPAPVARLLAGLCTNAVPDDACRPETTWHERKRLRSPHLPQGAPTSPALANLCARRLDARLAGLARSVGADYTRYADDLAFSGGTALERAAGRFPAVVATIALEEGFEVNTHKTRVLRRGVRQQLAGVVVNAHPNVRRAEYDRLKATLTNCVRHGPEPENRDGHDDFRSHLLGRIAHVGRLNPARGRRLREVFDRIDWDHRP